MRQIRVGIVVALLAAASAAAIAQTAPAAATGRSVAASINLNTATATELESLPGIGARTAARIVEYRQKHGGFKKIEELMNVRGVGEKSFLKLKSLITVAAPKPERTETR